MKLSRRRFCQTTLTGAVIGTLPAMGDPSRKTLQAGPPMLPPLQARWIWYPERRTLPNTFIFFRKAFQVSSPLVGKAAGWVTGNSRYKLYVNGRFVQRGPAPCDPRSWEIDPVDLTPHLRPGKNVIASLVCYFDGDGTYVPSTPVGYFANPGFFFQAEIPTASGVLQVDTDATWKTQRPRCWRAGSYQRWFLRSLQEEFDARLYPSGWETTEFDDAAWRAAGELDVPPGRPRLVELPTEGWHPDWKLTPRSIPLLREETVLPTRIANTGWVTWGVPAEEYFETFTTEAFREDPTTSVLLKRPDGDLFPLKVAPTTERTAAITFEFQEEVSGYLFVWLRAPAGTTIEILYVESQEPEKLLLRTAPQFGQWVRLVTREGEFLFETFEYDALRFLQLVIRGAREPVEVLEVGVRRRSYPYPHQPDLKTSHGQLNRAIAGGLNTHLITAQDTIVDNVARERQQYSGDIGHSKLASYYAFGEYRQPARMLRTFAQGQNDEGWFLDCWPAWDRCMRLWQKHLHLTQWGPLIDHGLEFVMSAAIYYLFSGDRSTIEELYPRFVKFDRFLATHVDKDGLLPVLGWTWNYVWLEHFGWKAEIDKHAAWNIYYAGYLKEGIAPLADWLGDRQTAIEARTRAGLVAERVRERYWSEGLELFVDNLPRIESDKEVRLHDRTLSMALLFNVVPMGKESKAVELLAGLPTRRFGPIFHLDAPKAEIGFSYPPNACWRLWALSRFGRGDAVVRDLRERWSNLKSLLMNNTFAESWEPRATETGDVWCQNGPVVLYVLYGDVLGIRPNAPEFGQFDVRPQIGDLDWIQGTVYAPSGAIRLRCKRQGQGLSLSLTVPANLKAGLVFPRGTELRGLPAETRSEPGPAPDTSRWRLPSSPKVQLWEIQAVWPR